MQVNSIVRPRKTSQCHHHLRVTPHRQTCKTSPRSTPSYLQYFVPSRRSSKQKINTDTELYVDTKHIQQNKKPLFFGAVQVKKRYVSFHLMPVYVDPGLLAGISEGLRKRMQGKSCFNFTQSEPALFKELAMLAQLGFAKYKERGFV
jgi:hypothetical protein